VDAILDLGHISQMVQPNDQELPFVNNEGNHK